MSISNSLSVLGAGSWGTALAIHLARNQQSVLLWGQDAQKMQRYQTVHCNTQYLADIPFPENLAVSADLSLALQAREIVIAVPSDAFRTVITAIKPYVQDRHRFILATKGIDSVKHQLLHEVLIELLGEHAVAMLSGPSFAHEVASSLPTAVTIATQNDRFAEDLVNYFHSKTFRVYRTQDIVGVEISGAMKNIMAIAVGIADGLSFGANARSALITRGLAEIIRFGTKLGGKPETFMGLAGVGDLVLTCTDNQSRNRRFGLALGKGNPCKQALQSIGQVVEGFRATAEIYLLAKQYQVEVPICEQVYHVLYENLAPKQAVDNLLSRQPKNEDA